MLWIVLVVGCLPFLVATKETHAFYYLWYGNPAIDRGEFKHWNHEVLPHWEQRINEIYTNIGQRFNPPDDLHSPFYPSKGPYSSSDPVLMRQHFHEILDAEIDVIVASWWGQESKAISTDTQGVNTDRTIRLLLQTAHEFNQERLRVDPNAKLIQIAFHLEPYPTRSVESILQDIHYIIDHYSHYSSFYKNPQTRKPLFYVYDSYHIPSFEWSRLLSPQGEVSIRSTKYDGTFIGLWLNPQDGRDLVAGGFDGIYSYFASNGFSFASSLQNWENICKFCLKKNLLCSLSVGPGYNDALIRPWNDFNTKDRE
jgi:glycoprotein endo-alpha-1,2-mannosidase